jgi:hypothetical protein
VSQSTDVEDSTSYLSSDAHEYEGVQAPKYDEDSMPYPIYDTYDNASMIVPKYDEDWVIENLSWDMDQSSQEPCMEDDKGEVDFDGDSTHESHLTGQCTISKYCMASSSESRVVDGDNILIDENKSKYLLCDMLDFVARRYFCIGDTQHAEETKKMSL